jgi:cytoskeleton protein RodZ
MSEGRGSPSDSSASAAPGQRLKAERESRGLSVQQVAENLHVGVDTIDALEAGRFAALGAPVYARGHLRKYARMLGLDAETLVSAYETAQAPLPELVPLKPATRASRFRVSPAVVATVIAAAVTAALGWVVMNRAERPAPVPAPPVTVSQPVTATEASTGHPVAESPPAAMPPAAVAPPAAPRQDSGRPEGGAERVRVQMSFTADSWVEIYDSSEQRVFFDMGTTGTTRAVSAAAPLRVFLGFADGVQLLLDGRAVAVPPEAKRGNLAEFSLDARGHVRPERKR